MRKELIGEGLDAGLIDVVAWEDREQFVDSGALPQSAYARCDEHIEDKLLVKPAEPMTWGELARSLGVPWHVCPAPVPEARHLCLVKRSAVVDADDVSPEGAWVLKGKAWRKAREKHGAGKDLSVDDEMGERELQREEKKADSFDLERERVVVARLMARKETVMQDGLWKPLVRVARDLARAELPEEVSAQVSALLAQDDSSNRQGLRHVMAWLFAVANHWEREALMVEVERALGVGGERLA